jgi:hypothetical protein
MGDGFGGMKLLGGGSGGGGAARFKKDGLAGGK